jgi:hypothetical protein
MAGGKWASKIQLGRETTAGDAVAATAIWRGVGSMLQDTRNVTMVAEQVGIAIPTTRSYIPQIAGSLAMAATPATFEQLPHILEAGIKTVGSGVADGAGDGLIYAYPFPTTALNTLKTYTIETGDNQQAEEMEYSYVERFTLSGARGESVMMSADWVGRQVTNVSFTGALTVPTVEEILSQKGTLYIDDAGSGTIGTTAITNTLLTWELAVTTGWKAKFTLDNNALYFAFNYYDKDSFSAVFTATFEHNATAVAEKTEWRNEVARLIRLELLGTAFAQAGTAYDNKTLRIDLPCKYTEWSALDFDEGNSIVNVTAVAGYDETEALGGSITVVNELASIP